MSTALAPNTRPLRAPEPARRPLRAVPLRSVHKARPRLSYAITTVVTVCAIVAAQLLVSVTLSQGAYQLSALKSEQRDLGLQQQSLNEQLQVLNSPQYISENAQALGMVINQSPSYLTLSSGAILGAPGSGGAATERPMQDGYVYNSLTERFATVTAEEKAAESKTAQERDQKAAGESGVEAKTPPVTFEDGLPSPDTH